MRVRAPRSIGISLVTAAMVLGTPASAARRRLLDRMSQVGLALLLTSAPCVLTALFLLFAS